ncbi:hypothetical protein M514_16569, partial [Trichuris suis]
PHWHHSAEVKLPFRSYELNLKKQPFVCEFLGMISSSKSLGVVPKILLLIFMAKPLCSLDIAKNLYARSKTAAKQVLQSLTAESSCDQGRCSTTEDCFAGQDSTSDTCLESAVRAEGKLCTVLPSLKDKCAPGLQCMPLSDRHSSLGICVHPNRLLQRKDYFETCDTSLECDTSKQLCCREQHSSARGESRHICSYFEDPVEDCIF